MSKHEVLLALHDEVRKLALDATSLDKKDIAASFQTFGELREFKGNLEIIMKIISGMYENLSKTVLPELMEENKIESIKTGGYNFVLAVRTNCYIPVAQREEGHKWLRENGLGALIVEQTNTKQLSAALSEYMEDTNKEPPKEAIVINRQPFIQARRS